MWAINLQQRGKDIQWGEDILVNKWGQENWAIPKHFN